MRAIRLVSGVLFSLLSAAALLWGVVCLLGGPDPHPGQLAECLGWGSAFIAFGLFCALFARKLLRRTP
jgi:hypothetical protein